MHAETEVVREFYAALNRNDVPAMLKLLDPQIVRIEPESFQSGGPFRGLEELREHISKARETWAEGSCTPERFQVSGNKIIAFVHVRVRLKNKPEWLEGRLADGFAFLNGKIIEFQTFEKEQQAIDWSADKA